MANESHDVISLKKNNSSAKVHLFGATLISWNAGGEEAIFVSKKSHFDSVKPIRGGVPFVFPQFGPWKCGPQHGFARRMKWSLKENAGNVSDSATFVLEDSESTHTLWNYKFRIEYKVALISDTQLEMNAVIKNTGSENFDFTFLLHTYFSVPNVENCSITGLRGCNYIDKVKNNSSFEEKNEEVKLSEFTDRIYQSVPSVLKLKNVSGDRNIQIEKVNFPDTVVWNPWAEGAQKMDDFGDDEWPTMICVEAGYVASPCILAPGEDFKASQVLTICK